MNEGINPTRRYKFVRPRQCSRGHHKFTATNGYSIVTLYNNSTGAQYLVVRDFQLGEENSLGTFGLSYVKGLQGTQGGVISNVFPDDATLPGILTGFDSPTVPTPDYRPFQNLGSTFNVGYWTHDFPIAVLPPNWALAFLDTAQTKSIMDISVFWESVFADELDYAFEL